MLTDFPELKEKTDVNIVIYFPSLVVSFLIGFIMCIYAAIRSIRSMLWSYTSTWRTNDCCGI
jgi:flagellar biosynthesis protein FliQ